MLAFSFFVAIFSSFMWLIYALAYINDNTVGIKFSSLGLTDISIYVALTVLPIFLLWMIFGYINQYITNRKTNKALYLLFTQMKKNQDYTDLIARIMLESEQQIKDGFILSRIDILIADMNELIAEVISRASLASREQIEALWSKVRNGGKWALGKVIIEINQNQPNFQMRLYEKSQKDVVLSGTILEFCARYQNILSLLGKHDGERVFLNVIETGVFGKVYTILAPLADEIRKYRDTFYNQEETEFRAPAPQTSKKAPAQNPNYDKIINSAPKKNPIMSGISKIGSFMKKENKVQEPEVNSLERDPLSIALERSFGNAEEENEINSDMPTLSTPDTMEEDAPKAPQIVYPQEENNESIILEPQIEENNAPEIILDDNNTDNEPYLVKEEEAPSLSIKPEPIAVPITNTQKALNSLKKEWEDMRASSQQERNEPSLQAPQNEDEDRLNYPFGGWTDESNYNK